MVDNVRGIFLHTAEVTLYVCGTPITLTRSEIELFSLLLKQPGRVYSLQTLSECINTFNKRLGNNNRNIHSVIARLRRKIHTKTGYTNIICTHYGLGYSLDRRWYNQKKPKHPASD